MAMRMPYKRVARMAKLTLLVGCLLLSGCYLVSVHPIATPDQQSFDRHLIGAWASGSDTLRIAGDDIDNMEFTVIEGIGPMNDSVRSGSLDILVTSIRGRNFLDVRPGAIHHSRIPVFEQTLLIPMHAIIRYRISGDSLILQSLSFRKFDRKARSGRAYGLDLERVAADGPLLLTSKTEKIRRFLAKYGGEEALFDEPIVYLRQK
jgi:hypothetical protein